MQPLSTELLTILVIISISLASITFIIILIFSIIYLYKCCSKRRQSKVIKTIPTHSIGSTVSITNHSPAISPIPITKNSSQNKKFDQHYHTNQMTDEHSYLNNNNKNKSQQQESIHDDYDETTTTINESQMYDQRQKKRFNQSIKPMTNIRMFDRHTPYPPDVIARERLMNHNRFSMNDKY